MAQIKKPGHHFIVFTTLLVVSSITHIAGSCTSGKSISTDDSSKIVLFLDTTVLGPFCFPVHGKVISKYGKRGSRMHTGTDIKLSRGDTVKAAFTGVVTKAATYYGYGILVVLNHPGNIETYYAHLSKALVKEGDTIAAGTPLGLGGRTGRATTEHLHFEIRKNGKALNSEHFFDFNGLSIKSLVMMKNSRSKPPVIKAEAVTTKTVSKPAQSTASKPAAKPADKSKAPAGSATNTYHTIRQGDTLFSLSRKYGTTVDEICRLNNIQKNGILKIGQKIRVN